MDGYREAIGDAAGEAQEQVLSDWIESNREILRRLKLELPGHEFIKAENIIKSLAPT